MSPTFPTFMNSCEHVHVAVCAENGGADDDAGIRPRHGALALSCITRSFGLFFRSGSLGMHNMGSCWPRTTQHFEKKYFCSKDLDFSFDLNEFDKLT